MKSSQDADEEEGVQATMIAEATREECERRPAFRNRMSSGAAMNVFISYEACEVFRYSAACFATSASRAPSQPRRTTSVRRGEGG
jgi:hypothetical protein